MLRSIEGGLKHRVLKLKESKGEPLKKVMMHSFDPVDESCILNKIERFKVKEREVMISKPAQA